MDVVGFWLKVIFTSSVDTGQAAFDTVHLNVYVEPETPENVELAEVGVVIDPPVPAVMVQTPVPIDGTFAAKVTDVIPHVAAPN